MKRTVRVGMTAATVLMSVALAAQAPGTPKTAAPQQQQPRTDATMAGKMTVSGCIERADQVAGSSGVDSQMFVLTNVTSGPASSASGGAVGTTGAPKAPSTSSSSSSSARTTTGTIYRLDAETAKLTPHVGHRVEIVGTMTPATGTGSAGARPTDPDAPSEPTAPAATASFRVESIKMISQTCAR